VGQRTPGEGRHPEWAPSATVRGGIVEDYEPVVFSTVFYRPIDVDAFFHVLAPMGGDAPRVCGGGWLVEVFLGHHDHVSDNELAAQARGQGVGG
jgi:hypothetical protein